MDDATTSPTLEANQKITTPILLSPRQLEVLKLRFTPVNGLPATYKEISEKLDIPAGDARTIVNNALKKLRNTGIDPEEYLAQLGLTFSIDKKQHLLSPRQLEVLKLRFTLVNGLPPTYKEMSDKLNMTEGSARTMVYDALKRLRQAGIEPKEYLAQIGLTLFIGNKRSGRITQLQHRVLELRLLSGLGYKAIAIRVGSTQAATMVHFNQAKQQLLAAGFTPEEYLAQFKKK